MASAAWEALDGPDDYEAHWQRFEALYGFRHDTEPNGWPAIDEPPGSVTFDLTPAWVEDGCGFWTTQAVNALVVRALACVLPPSEPVVVLCWNHRTHRFWPHRLPDTWHLDDLFPAGPTPVPEGEYYAFLSEDMTSGTFGHPWERTLCVIGPDLVTTLAPSLSPLLPEKRRAP